MTFDIDKIINKKMIHNGKVRKIEGNDENEAICKQIKFHIDEMEKNMAAKQIVSSMRQSLNGRRSLPKSKYAKYMTAENEIINKETDRGFINISSALSTVNRTNKVITSCMETMNLTIDDILQKQEKKRELIVDTRTMKTEVYKTTTGNAMEIIINNSPSWKGDSKNWIAYRLDIMKDLMDGNTRYNYHYNKVKDLFKQGTDETFPLTFRYNGVFLHWQDTFKRQTLYHSVYEYLTQNEPDRLDEFESCIKQQRIIQNNYTLLFLLDGKDYMQVNGTHI